jgi:hypothetical protein
MPDRIPAMRSLTKRLRADLRDALGDDAPEVLHLWIDGGLSEGIVLRARVVRGATERLAIGSWPLWHWETAYQRLLADCQTGWGGDMAPRVIRK